MLDRLLHRGQGRAGCLPLARGLDLAVGGVAICLIALIAEFLLQYVQVEVAQGIGAQTAALETRVGGDVWIGLQQIGDSAEDLGA